MRRGTPGDDEAPAEELTVPAVLRLLGAGASGAILVALARGPLRTKALTEQVPGYTPRTVYRYAGKLTQLGLIEREEEPGVPSKVVHSLSDPRGRELLELVDAYADASLIRLTSGEIDAHAWGSLALLADLWESKMIEALNFGPRSPTELARVEHGLSYHQVNRRAGLFAIGGFLDEESTRARRRSYELTEKTRRGMALIVGLGRWRQRHLMPAETPGLTPREAASALRTALPLVALPEHAGKSFGIEIAEETDAGKAASVWAVVEPSGVVASRERRPPEVDDHLRLEVASLLDALTDGSGREVQGGGGRLIETCLERLRLRLWEPEGSFSSSPAEAMADGGDGAELSYR
jgi:DNA-binding HxlR family transcriptional regulator